MYADFIYPEYEVVRNYQRCIACRACERQCANEVHRYDADEQMMTADDAKCVNCHRCVSLCPTRALKIVRTDADRGLILVEGAVPGAKGGWILVRDAVKKKLPEGVPTPGKFRKAAPAATAEAGE